jgi:transcriptional regulator with XRE-family HTH domain
MLTVEEFGEQLQAMRDELGLAGTVVAERAGIAPSTLYAIENGRRTPRGATQRRLARAFDMSLEEFKARMAGDQPGKGGGRSQLEAGRALADRLERLVEDAERRDERSDVRWSNWWVTADEAAKLSEEYGFEELAERFRTIYHQALQHYEGLFGGQDAHGEEFDRLLERLNRESQVKANR